MNILLTHAYFLEEDEKERKIMRPYPPLGILYISAFLERHNITHEVFDTTFSRKDIFFSYLSDRQPRIIGIYVNLMTKPNVLKIIQYCRQNLPGTKIILGGPDVRYNAEKYLRQGADYIVFGEGEITFKELTDRLIKGESAGDLSGISYLDGERLVENPEREKIKDLDVLPFPNRKKIDLAKYLQAWKSFHGKSTISVSTMRGCPYTCKWCSRGVYGLSYRRRSPAKVVEELAEVKKEFNPDSFWFVDDVFTISHKWLREFHEALKEKNISIAYECITRADRMNEEVVKLLKATGCFRVWIGAESGSQKIIDLMDRRVDVKQVRDMIRLASGNGIETGTFIMLGYPGETEEDIDLTIQHLVDSKPDHFTITIAYPIKGTDLYQEVESTSVAPGNWEVITDRQIDFERSYSRQFYNYAVTRVVSEVGYSRSQQNQFHPSRVKLKAKSILALMGMRWEKIRGSHKT